MESIILSNYEKSLVINNQIFIPIHQAKLNRLDYIVTGDLALNGLCDYISKDSFDLNRFLTFNFKLDRDLQKIYDDLMSLAEPAPKKLKVYRTTAFSSIGHCEENIEELLKPCNIDSRSKYITENAFISTTLTKKMFKTNKFFNKYKNDYIHTIDIEPSTSIIDVDKHAETLCSKYPYLIENPEIFEEQEIILVPPVSLKLIKFDKKRKTLHWSTVKSTKAYMFTESGEPFPDPVIFNILDNLTSFDIDNLKNVSKLYQKKLEEPKFVEYINKKILQEKNNLIEWLSERGRLVEDEDRHVSTTVNNNEVVRKIELEEIPDIININKSDTSSIPFFIGHLTNLRTLTLNCSLDFYNQDEDFHENPDYKISKIENLDKLINLTTLNFTFNNIEKIENLETLINLTNLDLSYNNIEKIENLETLINLTNLFLMENKIQKIENLDKLINLTNLFLMENKIQKIENLDKLINLIHLDIRFNEIRKIENLDKLVKLISLYITGNPIINTNYEKSGLNIVFN